MATEMAYVFQRRAVNVLSDLLLDAGRAGLPPLVWSVESHGALVGRVCCDTNTSRRMTFQRWKRFVAAQQLSDSHGAWTVMLRARHEDFDGVRIVLLAELNVDNSGGDDL